MSVEWGGVTWLVGRVSWNFFPVLFSRFMPEIFEYAVCEIFKKIFEKIFYKKVLCTKPASDDSR